MNSLRSPAQAPLRETLATPFQRLSFCLLGGDTVKWLVRLLILTIRQKKQGEDYGTPVGPI